MTKTTRRRLLGIAAEGGIAVAGTTVATELLRNSTPVEAGALDAAAGFADSSWFFRVEQTTPPAPTRYQCDSFHAGGTVIVTSPPGISPGHGVWAATGERTVAVTVKRVLYDEQANPTGVLTVRSNGELDPSGTTSTFGWRYDVHSFDGALLLSAEGVSYGTRIQLEPLD